MASSTESPDTISVVRIKLDSYDEHRWTWMDVPVTDVGVAFSIEPLGNKKIRTYNAQGPRLYTQGWPIDFDLVTVVNGGNEEVDGRYVIVFGQPDWYEGPLPTVPPRSRVHVCDEVFVARLKRIGGHASSGPNDNAYKDWELVPFPSREAMQQCPALMQRMHAEFTTGYTRQVEEPKYWAFAH